MEKPSSFGSDLHLHRNIRQKKRSVKNNQGFPLHYQAILPAKLLESGRQRTAPSHCIWYKHFPTTGSVPLSKQPSQYCTPGSCPQSHHSRSMKLQTNLASKSFGLSEQQQRAPGAKLPNTTGGEANRGEGRKSFST